MNNNSFGYQEDIPTFLIDVLVRYDRDKEIVLPYEMHHQIGWIHVAIMDGIDFSKNCNTHYFHTSPVTVTGSSSSPYNLRQKRLSTTRQNRSCLPAGLDCRIMTL